MEQVQQLNLLRESNVMLRDDNVRANKRVTELEKEKSKATAAIEPLKKSLKDVQATKGSLEADKAALTKEVGNWKERVKSMTSKFHQIDPTEHTEALAKVDTLTKELGSAKQLLTRTRQEFSKAKTNVDKLTKEKEALVKQVAEKSKGTNGMKELKEKLASKETELKGSNVRLEKFRELLRKMKADSHAKVKRIEELEGELTKAKEAGGKEKEKEKEKEEARANASGAADASAVNEEAAKREKALAKMKQSKADKAAKLAKLKVEKEEKEKLEELRVQKRKMLEKQKTIKLKQAKAAEKETADKIAADKAAADKAAANKVAAEKEESATPTRKRSMAEANPLDESKAEEPAAKKPVFGSGLNSGAAPFTFGASKTTTDKSSDGDAKPAAAAATSTFGNISSTGSSTFSSGTSPFLKLAPPGGAGGEAKPKLQFGTKSTFSLPIPTAKTEAPSVNIFGGGAAKAGGSGSSPLFGGAPGASKIVFGSGSLGGGGGFGGMKKAEEKVEEIGGGREVRGGMRRRSMRTTRKTRGRSFKWRAAAGLGAITGIIWFALF